MRYIIFIILSFLIILILTILIIPVAHFASGGMAAIISTILFTLYLILFDAFNNKKGWVKELKER